MANKWSLLAFRQRMTGMRSTTLLALTDRCDRKLPLAD